VLSQDGLRIFRSRPGIGNYKAFKARAGRRSSVRREQQPTWKGTDGEQQQQQRRP
jgi:hypothetical protein